MTKLQGLLNLTDKIGMDDSPKNTKFSSQLTSIETSKGSQQESTTALLEEVSMSKVSSLTWSLLII